METDGLAVLADGRGNQAGPAASAVGQSPELDVQREAPLVTDRLRTKSLHGGPGVLGIDGQDLLPVDNGAAGHAEEIVHAA